jgi:hypothetical protein
MRFESFTTLIGVITIGLLASCSSETTTSTGAAPPAGTYVGDLVVQHDDPAKSVFTTATLTIASGGAITGSATTKQPTAKIGESGTVTGTLTGGDPVDVAIVMTYPTMGTFRAHGAVVYAASTRQLAISSLTTDDGTPKVVGRTTGVLQLQ